MPKNPLHVITVALMLFLASNNISASNTEELQTYIKKNFPVNLQINSAQIAQLSWILHHPKHSNDMDLHINHKNMHIEISRALTRLYCLQLLRSGKKIDYQQFVAGQVPSGNNIPLTFASFTKLSK